MGLLAGVALDMARLEQKRENERTRERENESEIRKAQAGGERVKY